MVRGLSAAQWSESDDAETLAAKLSQSVAQNLAETLNEHERASLVLSGGSTPLPFFKQLSQCELEWDRVDVTLADERWVPESDPDSNARFIKENFLVDKASSARFFSLYRDGDPVMAIAEVENALQEIEQPYSVVVLGMGTDGHTASLFPQTEGLEEALDLGSNAILATMAPASVPQVRISFTRAALLKSRYRYLHITGEKKRQVLSGELDSDTPSLPIASFFEKHLPPISVYWSP